MTSTSSAKKGVSLTAIEIDSLASCARGLSQKSEALRGNRGLETVKTVRIRLRQKLGAKTMAQAVFLACKAGLI